MDYIKSAFSGQGAIWMWLIILPSVAALALIIERSVFLLFRYNINAKQFFGQIQKLVMANNIDRAIKLCNAADKAVLPKIMKAGLTRANKGDVEVSNAMEESTLEITPDLQKRTNTLQPVANVATLLGLLGTISGLIQAFGALANAPADQKATLLANGIAIAMNTTAYGLIVAIPLMLVHVFLSNTTKKILDEVDQYTVKLQNLLAARGRGQVGGHIE